MKHMKKYAFELTLSIVNIVLAILYVLSCHYNWGGFSFFSWALGTIWFLFIWVLAGIYIVLLIIDRVKKKPFLIGRLAMIIVIAACYWPVVIAWKRT